tara:strand:- start:36 stop:665 length:630 start_codon:yes stop_codon:yes gene_type:complete
MGELIFLGLLALIAVSAVWVVVSPNLVHSATSLLITLFGVAGLYVFLYADFLAATQIVIYVGGILVLIIFGVMLTNKIDKPVIASNSSNKIIGVLISSFIFSILSIIVIQTNWPVLPNNTEGPSTVELIGKLILGKYLLPFELISILLLSALVGAALLARKKIVNEESRDNNLKSQNNENDNNDSNLDSNEIDVQDTKDENLEEEDLNG